MLPTEFYEPDFSVKLDGKKVVEVTITGLSFITRYRKMGSGIYHMTDIDEECDTKTTDKYLNWSQLPSWIKQRFRTKFDKKDTITQD